jgi:acetyl-CoA carboxylase carboxyl transferase subunit alpha
MSALSADHTLTPSQRVALARRADRPNTSDYIKAIFGDFFEQRGDRLRREDPSILGGIALFHGQPVTIIGHRKGHELDESIRCNFGMPGPEGYRKALRLMEQAEKFRRPIITLIDTPGAYPGLEAEAGGQGAAIAHNLAVMSRLSVPTITIVIGEGGSGGALALGVSDRILMLENATYAILSPEGFATILWKDGSRAEEACSLMRLTAHDLVDLGIADEIIREPAGGAQENPAAVFSTLDEALQRHLGQLGQLNTRTLVAQRYRKYRVMGTARGRKA